ncbi:MAG: hypothetical protein LBF37_02265 [Rickettsiales bacterium]|jgi:hypothetical protein|nr:hypothetical protein [Rickettsiales bacterium]
MINDDKLQYAYDILHGKPWKDRADLIDTLTYLANFHESLCRDYYDEDKAIKWAEDIFEFFIVEMGKSKDQKNDLLNYSNLDEDKRKVVILSIYEILKEYAYPDFEDLEIIFRNDDTRISARADRGKTITFFNVETNPQLKDYKRLINIAVHEFVHLMQSTPRTTLPKNVVDMAQKYYCSFAAFDKFDVKDLTSKAWRNNVIEKEAITIGEYIEDNLNI